MGSFKDPCEVNCDRWVMLCPVQGLFLRTREFPFNEPLLCIWALKTFQNCL